MNLPLSVLGLAFAAFCVWLAVRVVNRRERWARWTLSAAIIAAPVLYMAGFGVASWLYDHDYLQHDGDIVKGLRLIYAPLKWADDYWPQSVGDALRWYEGLFRR